MKLTIPLTLAIVGLFTLPTIAQKKQGQYTIGVYPVTNPAKSTTGPAIKSNDQIKQGEVYKVTIKSTSSPAAIWVDAVDGFEIGCLCGTSGKLEWQAYQLPNTDPNKHSENVGSATEYTAAFYMKALEGAKFALPFQMRIRETPTQTPGVTTGAQLVKFPY